MIEARKITQMRGKIDELRANEGIRTAIKCNFIWTADGGDKTEYISFPPREAINSAALDIRHFIAPGSQFVMGALIKEIRKDERLDREEVEKFYHVWLRTLGGKGNASGPFGWAIYINDVPLTLEKQIDLWMNGQLFHVDEKKYDELEGITFSDIRDKTWVNFVETLRKLTKLLLYFDKHFLEKLV